jgi:hypothetical protein
MDIGVDLAEESRWRRGWRGSLDVMANTNSHRAKAGRLVK